MVGGWRPGSSQASCDELLAHVKAAADATQRVLRLDLFFFRFKRCFEDFEQSSRQPLAAGDRVLSREEKGMGTVTMVNQHRHGDVQVSFGGATPPLSETHLLVREAAVLAGGRGGRVHIRAAEGKPARARELPAEALFFCDGTVSTTKQVEHVGLDTVCA